MTIQELEIQLLSLTRGERFRLSQLLVKSLAEELPRSATKPKLIDTIDQFRRNMSPEELDPNTDDIWMNVRDRTPAPLEPRW
jgi:hypothetical protein